MVEQFTFYVTLILRNMWYVFQEVKFVSKLFSY